MAFDLKRSTWSNQEDVPRHPTAVFDEEAQLVISSLLSGEEVAVRGSAAGSLNLLGFALLTQMSPGDTRVYSTTAVIPSVAPYTITIGHPLITAIADANGDASAQLVVAGTFLTLVAGAPNTGEFQVSSASGGVLTFNAAQAGLRVGILARVTMTAREQTGLFQQRHINADSQPDVGMVGVMGGKGVLYTDQFDLSVGDWTSGALTTGAAGVFSIGGAGTDLSAKCHVVHAPTVEDPWLGVRFNLGQ